MLLNGTRTAVKTWSELRHMERYLCAHCGISNDHGTANSASMPSPLTFVKNIAQEASARLSKGVFAFQHHARPLQFNVGRVVFVDGHHLVDDVEQRGGADDDSLA